MFEKDGMKKLYSFDHTKSDILSAMGVGKERYPIMMDFMSKADKRFSTTSKVIQEILNTDELSDPEKIFLLFALGRHREKRRSKSSGGMHVVSIEGDMPKELKEMLHDVDSRESFEKFMAKVKSLSKKHDGCDGDCKECGEDE